MKIASYIDHSFLSPTAEDNDIIKICKETLEFGFAAVCIPPPFVALAKAQLGHSDARVATVIGFPFGYSNLAAKLAEIREAMSGGADELDTVINLTALKNAQWNYLSEEMGEITTLVHQHHKKVKVIIETGVLTETEIIRCCELYADLSVDYLKTSTGYAQKGATPEVVRLMRKHLPGTVLVKASGGIRTFDQAMELISAGAARLGCSNSVAIAKSELP